MPEVLCPPIPGAFSALGLVGYDNVLSYRPGWDGWTEAGEEVSTEEVMAEVVGAPDIEPELLAAVDAYMSTIPEGFNSAGDAAKFLEAADAGSFVLDVRTADEFAAGHLEAATHVDLRALATGIDMVPTDAATIVHCGSGHRAAMALPALAVLDRASSKAYGGTYDSLVEAVAAELSEQAGFLVVDDFHGNVAGLEFCHGREFGVGHSVFQQPGGLVHHISCGFYFGRHFGDFKLSRLEGA